jgi:hypothetical protein
MFIKEKQKKKTRKSTFHTGTLLGKNYIIQIKLSNL